MKKVIITMAIAALCFSSYCCNNQNKKAEGEAEKTECCDKCKEEGKECSGDCKDCAEKCEQAAEQAAEQVVEQVQNAE